jgi:hypothetical protein
MVELSDITLVTVGSNKGDDAVKALILSSREIKFGAIKLFTFDPIQDKQRLVDHNIKLIPLLPPFNYWDYGRFMIHKLNSFIDLKFCLSIHTDGFVLNPHLWTDEFYNYDYIGASWSSEQDHRYGKYVSPEAAAKENWNKVGNSGFCLRSKQLLELGEHSPYRCGDIPDDVYICRNYEDYFVNNGVKFAPVEIATKFSQDPLTDLNSTFGFHGDKQYIHSFLI